MPSPAARFLALASLAAALVAPARAETRFFDAIADLPLPPGFQETQGGWSFSTEEGRIIEAAAEGEGGDGLVVRQFYIDALPALGWAVSPRNDGVLMFERGREQLTLTFETKDGVAHLGARLVVAPASMARD